MSFFIPDAFAQGAGPNAATTGVFNIVMLMVFVGMLYFLLLRPQIKRAKQHKQMVEALAKGDEVVSSGGLLGKITQVEESFVIIEIAKGMEVRLQKGSVASVLPKGTYKPVNRTS
jgi:preprotein translocase subunit YajC